MDISLLILTSTSLFVFIFIQAVEGYEDLNIRKFMVKRAGVLAKDIEIAERSHNSKLVKEYEMELKNLSKNVVKETISTGFGYYLFSFASMLNKIFQIYVIITIIAAQVGNLIFGFLTIAIIWAQTTLFYLILKDGWKNHTDLNEWLGSDLPKRFSSLINILEILPNLYVLYTILVLLGVLS